MSEEDFEKLNEELVAQNPWWKYKKDEFRKPNGETGNFHYVKTQGEVVIIPWHIQKSQLVAVKNYRYLAQEESIEFPAGHNPKVAAKRELEEEAGFKPDSIERVGMLRSSSGIMKDVVHVFLAFVSESIGQNLDDTEDIEVFTIDPLEFQHKAATKEVTHGESLAAWTVALKEMQNKIDGFELKKLLTTTDIPEQKLEQTPQTEVKQNINGIKKYQLPEDTGHIKVADFATIEEVQDYNYNTFELVRNEDEISLSGSKYILCQQGEVKFCSENEEIILEQRESIFVPEDKKIELSESNNSLLGIVSDQDNQTNFKKKDQVLQENIKIFEIEDEQINLSKVPASDFTGRRIYFWEPQEEGIYCDHAHRQERQLLYCIQGEMQFKFHDGVKKQLSDMNRKDDYYYNEEGEKFDEKGFLHYTITSGEVLLLPANIWYQLIPPTPGEDLGVVLTDQPYNRAKDYIEDFKQWQQTKIEG